ncbi:hypothetical protein B0H14DRAFT_3730079 [Mycena olivaceomarginata]|nr:hypothetical protein B0H14DRAFT_3730079 [Mycena olivaceomarginata]
MTSSGTQSHYTHRRANTALTTPLPLPRPVPEPAPPRRGGLARLQQLLPHSGRELKQSPSMKLKRKGSGKIVKPWPSMSVSISGASTPPTRLLSRGRMLLRRPFRLPTTPKLPIAGRRRNQNHPPSRPSHPLRAPPSPLPCASCLSPPATCGVVFGELLGVSSVPPLAGEDEEGAAEEGEGGGGTEERTSRISGTILLALVTLGSLS